MITRHEVSRGAQDGVYAHPKIWSKWRLWLKKQRSSADWPDEAHLRHFGAILRCLHVHFFSNKSIIFRENRSLGKFSRKMELTAQFHFHGGATLNQIPGNTDLQPWLNLVEVMNLGCLNNFF